MHIAKICLKQFWVLDTHKLCFKQFLGNYVGTPDIIIGTNYYSILLDIISYSIYNKKIK